MLNPIRTLILATFASTITAPFVLADGEFGGTWKAYADGETAFVKFADRLATERNVLISFGAGNDPDRIRIPGGAYNHLTVGGLKQNLTGVGTLGLARGATVGRWPVDRADSRL